MEDTCHVLKRKKRKTRRCLNEIRKKSRSSSNIQNTELENKIDNIPKKIGQTSHNNFITANRLTLALYPKAVRSETITRPLLAEIRHEPGNININNIVRNKYISKPENTAKENGVEAYTKNVHNTSANMFSDDDSGNSEKENGINSVIFEMDRVSDVTNDCDNDNGSAEGPSPARESAGSTAGFSPAPQLQEDYAYKKYVQFIREIPMYVQMHTPSILAEDPMRKPKALLQNMYLEEQRRLAEKERTSPTANMHEPLLENPMDYLKRYSTVSSLVSPASPALSQGSQSSLTETPSPPPPPSPREPPSIIQDTPEYTYFPHKLNQ